MNEDQDNLKFVQNHGSPEHQATASKVLQDLRNDIQVRFDIEESLSPQKPSPKKSKPKALVAALIAAAITIGIYANGSLDEREAKAPHRKFTSVASRPEAKPERHLTDQSTPVDEWFSSDCRIKGNISDEDGMVYHLPGTSHYDTTEITLTRGERWFCSEEEAREAGWRRSGSD